jgi:hypothetical protein
MSVRTVCRRPILFGLIAALAFALTTGSAPIAAQRAPTGDQPSAVASGGAFRSSPVMFIENTGQWDDRARFQAWGRTAGTMWLAENAIWITVVERSNDDVARSHVEKLERSDEVDGFVKTRERP